MLPYSGEYDSYQKLHHHHLHRHQVHGLHRLEETLNIFSYDLLKEEGVSATICAAAASIVDVGDLKWYQDLRPCSADLVLYVDVYTTACHNGWYYMPAISSGYSGRGICACTVARVLTYGGQRDCVENAPVVGH
jgi:hypothetical protein